MSNERKHHVMRGRGKMSYIEWEEAANELYWGKRESDKAMSHVMEWEIKWQMRGSNKQVASSKERKWPTSCIVEWEEVANELHCWRRVSGKWVASSKRKWQMRSHSVKEEVVNKLHHQRGSNKWVTLSKRKWQMSCIVKEEVANELHCRRRSGNKPYCQRGRSGKWVALSKRKQQQW